MGTREKDGWQKCIVCADHRLKTVRNPLRVAEFHWSLGVEEAHCSASCPDLALCATGNSVGVAGTLLQVCEVTVATSGQACRNCQTNRSNDFFRKSVPASSYPAATNPICKRIVKPLSSECQSGYLVQVEGYNLRVTIGFGWVGLQEAPSDA